MVGIHVRSGARLNAIRPICAPTSQWSSTGGVVTWSPSTFAGGTGGTLYTFKCARGDYMVGMETWAAKNVFSTPSVQGVVPICRTLSY